MMMTKVSFPVIDLQQTGRNIERCRREAGMSVRELQTYFGFEYPQAIYKWQHGECLPTVDNLLALSRIDSVLSQRKILFCHRGRFCFVTEEDSVLPRRMILFCHGRRFCFVTEDDFVLSRRTVLNVSPEPSF